MRIVIALLALAGCAPPPEIKGPATVVEAPPGAPGAATVGLGETARLGDVDVRPLAIVEDSRCPSDVQCIWAGRVRLRVAMAGVAGEPVLVLGEAFALPGGGAIILTHVAPARWHRPPSGVDVNAPPRFTFTRTGN